MRDAVLLFFQLGAANWALWSANYWMRSARIKITWTEIGNWDGPSPKILKQLQDQTDFNKKAAFWASISGLFAAISVCLQTNNPF